MQGFFTYRADLPGLELLDVPQARQRRKEGTGLLKQAKLPER